MLRLENLIRGTYLAFLHICTGSHLVDYQIHSNNDLLEWPQLLLKGARRFKVDPHFVPSKECEVVNITSEDGCFLLSHDRPLVKLNELYNSSDNLLSLLITESARYKKITVALCFKDAPDKCSDDSTQFQSWLRLVDDFYASATSLLDPAAVEFVLDGDGKPTDCLVGRWPNWNSVWINTGNPQEAFYSNSLENDYFRFQVLNDPENVANWTWMATSDVNYGKFSTSHYPYQLWEPDAQEDILQYIDIYRSGAEHGPGYHFAINVDIAMFQVYAQDATGSAINHPVAATDGATTPLIARFPLLTEWPCSIAVYVMSDGVVSYSILCPIGDNLYPARLDELSQESISAESSKWLIEAEESSLTSADTIPSEDGLSIALMILADSGNFVLQEISDTGVSGAHFKGTFLKSAESELFLDGRLGYCSDLKHIYDALGKSSVQPASNSSTCALTLSRVRFGSAGNAEMLVRIYEVSSVAIESGKLVLLAELHVPTPTESLIFSAKIVKLSPTAFAVFCSFDGVVYGTSLLKSKNPGSETLVTRWVALSVGNHVSLSEANGVIMMVTDFGFCFNSHKHNTRAYPTVCGTTPMPSDTVLDYSIGLSLAWEEVLQISACVYGSGTGCTEISPCHRSILHGSYDQGSHPSVVLNFRPSSQLPSYFFLEVHKGLSVLEINKLQGAPWLHDSLSDRDRFIDKFVGGNDNGCGIPRTCEGLVANSFDISNWIEALRENWP